MEYMSKEIDKLAEALAKMQGATTTVIKRRTAGAGKFSYKYADLPAIWDVIRKPLADNGLSVAQIMTQEKPGILTVLMHSSGQFMQSFMSIPINLEIQKLGSYITYVRRYSLSAILGISSEEDDDAESVKDEPTQTADTISAEETHEIENLLLSENPEYRQNLLNFYKIPNFFNINHQQKSAIMTSIQRKKSSKNMVEEKVPF